MGHIWGKEHHLCNKGKAAFAKTLMTYMNTV